MQEVFSLWLERAEPVLAKVRALKKLQLGVRRRQTRNRFELWQKETRYLSKMAKSIEDFEKKRLLQIAKTYLFALSEKVYKNHID